MSTLNNLYNKNEYKSFLKKFDEKSLQTFELILKYENNIIDNLIMENLLNIDDKKIQSNVFTLLITNELTLDKTNISDSDLFKLDIPLNDSAIKYVIDKYKNFYILDNNHVELLNLLIKNVKDFSFETNEILTYIASSPTKEIVDILNKENLFDFNKSYEINEEYNKFLEKMYWKNPKIPNIKENEFYTPLEILGNVKHGSSDKGFTLLYSLGFELDENKLSDTYKQKVQQINYDYSNKNLIESNLLDLLKCSNKLLEPIADNSKISSHEKIQQTLEKLKEYSKVISEYDLKIAFAELGELRENSINKNNNNLSIKEI